MSSGWMCCWQNRSVVDPVVMTGEAKLLHGGGKSLPKRCGFVGEQWGWSVTWAPSLQGFLSLSLELLIHRTPLRPAPLTKSGSHGLADPCVSEAWGWDPVILGSIRPCPLSLGCSPQMGLLCPL